MEECPYLLKVDEITETCVGAVSESLLDILVVDGFKCYTLTSVLKFVFNYLF